MNLVDLTLEGFTEEVASSSPAPGGGSVAAYAGSQGYALVAMVCRLTIGREKFAAVEGEMRELLDIAEDKGERLLSLVDEDTQGFKAVMDALSLPKSTDEEKAKRREAMEKATFKAAEIPLQTAKLCLEGLREVPKLLDGANPNALSDMGVAALMFKAGLDGALYNVRINAISLKTELNKKDLLNLADAFTMEGNILAAGIAQKVAAGLTV
ncbi:cyclodeaminase/cyclohydrolase family protein [Paradesulfitobacterium ferrireducens]|uniref:cyclodeaminase/cyclohydrolase family protein n=1 Tax=Paradesulfitobacterium ferrireducens TaxID=2816476 RepID=UPI001A8FD5E7|nr:cyclodeaminase/cyclohydrolase family protein [Paradesulfitobacterium ferrireducens]